MNWTINPRSLVSYHYLINDRGEVYETVSPEDRAWHAGRVHKPTWPGLRPGINPNEYTIGIGLSGFARNKTPAKQFIALALLLGRLARVYKIPLSAATVVFHREINAAKTCPGEHLDRELLLPLAELFKTYQVW